MFLEFHEFETKYLAGVYKGLFVSYGQGGGGGGLVFNIGGYKFQNQKKTGGIFLKTMKNGGTLFGYIVMLRARMFRSLIIRTGINERNIRARNITYNPLFGHL